MNEGNLREWCRLFKEDTRLAQTDAAARTRTFLEQFIWEIFEHFQYNPDLAPSDNHLFLYLKKSLARQSLRSDE
jgi:hypothetical protein